VWTYRYLAEAILERDSLVPKRKRRSSTQRQSWQPLGPRLPYPHSSAVKGADRLRELRPRGGRSPWRAFYRQIGEEFVVAAIGPEAQERPDWLHRGLPAAWGPAGRVRKGGVMAKLSESKTRDQLLAQDVRDPEVAAELHRTAVANQLAILLIQYRVEHGLTQTALARKLGMSQPVIARLEAGEHEPSVATLARLSRGLGITLRLDVAPESVVLVSA
jgi:DNA-binding XRE family transcriptional regulator